MSGAPVLAKHKKKRRRQLIQLLNGYDSIGFVKPSQLARVTALLAPSPTSGHSSTVSIAPRLVMEAGKRTVGELQPDVSRARRGGG